MRFTCTQENLARGLTLVGRVASKNVTLPILQNVLIATDDSGVRLQTTNLELGMRTVIRAKIETPGTYTVPAKLLSDLVSSLDQSNVTIEASDAGLKVTTPHTATVIKGLPAEDFPSMPNIDGGSIATLPASEFHRCLEGVIFAAANDESRPEISGVFLKIAGKNMTVVATDSYRLAERRATLLNGPDDEKSVILPARTAQELLRVLPVDDTIVTLALSDNQATISIQEVEVITRLIEGRYPDYQQIIPTQWTTCITVDRERFIADVRTASVSSQTGVYDLTLDVTVSPQSIQLSTASPQSGNEHHGTADGKVEGKDVSIVFNHRYLLDGLQSISGDTVALELTDAGSPGVLRSVAGGEDVYLIMPIRP